MSVATAKAVMADFLANDRPEVLALTGAWGIGKTYAWNQALIANKGHIKLRKYCYVSLFGLRSLAELRTALFIKTQPVKLIGQQFDAATVNKEWLTLASTGLKRLFSGGAAILRELPYGNSVSIGVEALAPHLVRDTIVCLDDFERQSALTAEDILGLISELKEEKACKIALIFNAEKLSAKDVYRSYREKVIDFEVLFAPTASEAFDLVFPADFPKRAQVVEHVAELDITNIRILRKTKDLLARVLGALADKHDGVANQAIATTVLLCWSAYAPDPTKPSIEAIAEWNDALFETKSKDEPVDEAKENWVKRLRSYGFMHVDDFDLALAKVIERGYLADTGFAEEAAKLDAGLRAKDVAEEFSTVWDQFHDSFADDQDTFIKNLVAATNASAKHIGPGDLDGTVKLLRDLQRDDLADALIEHYVEARMDEPRIFDLEKYAWGGTISDSTVRESFGKAHEALRQLPSLSEAVNWIVDHSGWNNEHVEALVQASVDDYYNFFMQDHGRKLSPLVKACLRFRGIEDHKEIGSKAREALERIKVTSELNALRVRKFGL